MINQPGMYPWETVEWNAITVGDLDGNQADWTWSKEYGGPYHHPDWTKVSKAVKNTPIQRVNLRSKYKPYSIWFPNRAAFPWGEGKAMFPYDCWNHWPVQQVQSDGINAMFPEKKQKKATLLHTCANVLIFTCLYNTYLLIPVT